MKKSNPHKNYPNKVDWYIKKTNKNDSQKNSDSS